MGLMLSILVVCVGVIEALSCFEHFQYGVIHCATNVYETARRRSSVFLQYTSRRLKLLSENSISEYDEQPEINRFQPIKVSESHTQLSEEESDRFASIRKPKAVRISTTPAKKLEKEDKIQIVKTLLERPRRPPTVRSISMPELVHTEEDIELSKIINDLAIEPIEEINIEIEEGNCDVLSRKFDELFNENEGEDSGVTENPLLDLGENVTDDLEHFEERKLAQLEVVRDFDDKSTSEEIEDYQENLESDDFSIEEVKNDQKHLITEHKSIKEDENEFPKIIIEKEKPVVGVIQTNISQRVSDRGADYFKEALSKLSMQKSKKSSHFDRSISVDFNKVPSMKINKPGARFYEISNDSMEIISEESIPHNKLEDIILESDTPPGEVIDKTFEEIYENLCDESLDAANSFEEIEKNILGHRIGVEGQGSPGPLAYVPEDESTLAEDNLQEGETSLSSGKTVPTAVFLKAVEQLAQLIVSDSLNLYKIKNLIYQNLSTLNLNEKYDSEKIDTQLRSQAENKSDGDSGCRIPEVKHVVKGEGKGVPNKECLREDPGKPILVKTDDLTDVRHPIADEECEKKGCLAVEGEMSNLSDAEVMIAVSNKTDFEPGQVSGHPVPERGITLSYTELGNSRSGNESTTQFQRERDQRGRDQEMMEKDGRMNKIENTVEKDEYRINSFLSIKEEAVGFEMKLKPEKAEGRVNREVLESAPTSSPVDSLIRSDISKNEIEMNVVAEIGLGCPQSKAAEVDVEREKEQHVEGSQVREDEIKINGQKNKSIDVISSETKVTDIPLANEPEKSEENEKENRESKVCTQPNISHGHSEVVKENTQTVKPTPAPLLALEFKEDDNVQQNKKETGITAGQEENKKVEMLEKAVTVDQKSTLPSEVSVDSEEKVKLVKSLPLQTEKPKSGIETVESKQKPLLAREFKEDDEVTQSKKETKIMAGQENEIVETLQKAVTINQKSTLPSEGSVEKSVEEKVQVAKLTPVEKPKDGIETVESKQEPVLALEFKGDDSVKKETKITDGQEENNKVKTVQKAVTVDQKSALPSEESVDPKEKVQVVKPPPVETEKPKASIETIETKQGLALEFKEDDNVKKETKLLSGEENNKVETLQKAVTSDQKSTLLSEESTDSKEKVQVETEKPKASIETIESKQEPLLALEFKEIDNVRKETKIMAGQEEINKVETLQKAVTLDQKSALPSEESVDSEEKVQVAKPLPVETAKPKAGIETVGSKQEPLLALEYEKGIPSEETKNQTELTLEKDKMEEIPLVEDEKSNVLSVKQAAENSAERLQQEKPPLIPPETPKESTKSPGDSDVIQPVHCEPLLALEFKRENNSDEKTVTDQPKNIKTEEILPEDTVKPAQTVQPVAKFHDKVGESENMEFQRVDSTEGTKSHSVTTNNSESTKTSIESKTESLNQDSQNGQTEKGIEVKDQSNKTLALNTEIRVMHEKNTLLPNEEETIDFKQQIQEGKHTTVDIEIPKENVKTEIGDSEVVVRKVEAVLVVEGRQNKGEQKEGVGEKSFEEGKNNETEEMRPGDVVKQSGELVLKFQHKPGETEDKVEFEQVGKNEVDKLHKNSKNETEPEKKGEHSSDSKNSKTLESGEATSSAPEAFWLIFSGEYTKAMSKDWHSGHFSCWQCDEALTGQRYVLRDDHPYCIKCYESVFANVCEECNKIIGIDSKDLSYKDKHWHEACFLCNKCRVSLVDKQFGSKADKIYCGNCYDAQFASRCDGCGEIFRAGTKKMEYKTRQWHEKCFCCCVCKTPIGTKSFIPREQEIYCATCYEEKFATRCVKCNKIITSGGVTYKNEPWHRECFTCTNCNTSLAGQRFTSRDEKPYCADCFGELFAKRCTACSRPITGIGGTRFISFEDRHWHNDCFICASCKTSLVGRGFITDGDDIICPECAKQKLM